MSVQGVNIITIIIIMSHHGHLVIDFTPAFKFCDLPNNNIIFTI